MIQNLKELLIFIYLVYTCNATLGLSFIGNSNVTVGENATISCFSDLSVLRLEWLLNGALIVSSSNQQIDLTFSPIQDYLHNREYTCRGVNAYGTLERRITISVHSKFLDIIRHPTSYYNIITILQFQQQLYHCPLYLWVIQSQETCMTWCVWQPLWRES